MNIELVTTEDGSHTLSVPDLKEHYHSVFGAISESRHIFIDAGLKKVLDDKKEINILEIGFGTGLNALMTLKELHSGKIRCNYTAVEAYPLGDDIIRLLNYPEILEDTEYVFHLIHESGWGVKQFITDNFALLKIHIKVQEMVLPEDYFDLVYFDAFSPAVQSEMWTVEIFSKLYTSMRAHSVLTTYSTKGDVKRALKESGFAIEKLAGPKGKREILRASK